MEIYTSNKYIKDFFGEKIYKISLNSGCSCPNRDGTLSQGGCIFCSNEGSGDFSVDSSLSIDKQIDEAVKKVSSKTNCDKYIGYFQSFTNTYGDAKRLRKLYMDTILDQRISAVSIGTRPDCLGEEILCLISDLAKIKPVWIELGLQTSKKKTAELINRCYDLKVYDKAVNDLRNIGNVHVITHMIVGLPDESLEDMKNTVRHIVKVKSHGIKIQLLHVLNGTKLEKMYEEHSFNTLEMEEYGDIVVELLRLIPKDMVVHRITGDGPKKILVSPLWSGDKKRVLNYLNKRIKEM